MTVIHKQSLGTLQDIANAINLNREIEIHQGARPVLFGKQQDRFTVWYEVDTGEPIITYEWFISGTGIRLPENARHIGSIIDGAFVWHFYWRRKEAE